MKIFDLNLALSGKDVITREGKRVNSIRYVNGVVHAEIGESSYKFTKEGKLLNSGIKSKFDLFMRPISIVEHFKMIWYTIRTIFKF